MMRATVVFNRRLSAAYRHLGLAAPAFPPGFAAGQFVMLRPESADAPFLPRAFSIYRLGGAPPVVEILYKVLGQGTQCLARRQAGEPLELLGPLGNSFRPPRAGEDVVFVAGGIGVPPISALAHSIRNPQSAIRNLHVFLGGKTSEDILCVKDFEEAGATVRITTEDGSLGTRGLITDLLEPFLAECRVPSAECRVASGGERREVGGQDLEPRSSNLEPASAPTPNRRPPTPVLYACGPPGMLRAVAALSERYSLPCQTSVEAAMACGFGACMGCAVEVSGSGVGPTYKLVCKDGPVFDSREIVWSAERSAECRAPGAEKDHAR